MSPLCEPCTPASQLDNHVEWLQFLVGPLLLEQWGLEAHGEIWYRGMACIVHTFQPRLARTGTSSSAVARWSWAKWPHDYDAVFP